MATPRANLVDIILDSKVMLEKSMKVWQATGWILIWGTIGAGALLAQSPPDALMRKAITTGPFPEAAPVIAPDGSSIFFARDNHPANYGQANLPDIWEQKLLPQGGLMPNALNAAPPLNTPQADKVFAIGLGRQDLYVATLSDDGRLGIAIANREGRSWRTPQPMVINGLDSVARLEDCFVTSDGRLLFACIDHPDDGWGQSDIYVAVRKNALEWSHLINLGPTINTPGRELSVFLAPDGQTLYFSSDAGPAGLGGQDLYYSHRIGNHWDHWTPPVNLGPSINSAADELDCSTDAAGERAFFAVIQGETSRIFQAPLPEALRPKPVILLRGKIKNALTQEGMAANLSYFLINEEGQGDLQNAQPFNSSGQFQILLPRASTIGLYADADGFFSPSYLLELGQLQREGEDQPFAGLMNLETPDPEYALREERIQAAQFTLTEVEKRVLSADRAVAGSVESLRKSAHQVLQPTFFAQPSTYDRELVNIRNEFKRNLEVPDPLDFHDTGKAPKVEPEEAFRLFLNQVEEKIRLTQLEPAARGVIAENVDEVVKIVGGKMVRDSASVRWLSLNDQIELRKYTPTMIQALVQEVGKKTPTLFSASWQRKLETQMQSLYTPRIQSDLLNELKKPIRQLIQDEMELRVVQKVRQRLQDTIAQLLNLQKQTELKPRRSNPVIFPPATPAPVAKPLDTLVVPATSELTLDLELFPLPTNQRIILENLVFLPNSADLDSIAYNDIQRLALLLSNYPDLDATILAYSNGSLSYEQASSITEQRAKAIVDLLVNTFFFSPERFKAVGAGKTNPLVPNDSVKGRCKNQRIELQLTRRRIAAD